MKQQDQLSKGGRPQKSDNREQDITSNKPTLKELGVEKIESQRWQRIAGVQRILI